MLVQLLIRFFAPVSFLNINNKRHGDFYKKKKIISASRALREFAGTLIFGEKGQLSNKPTVVYLRQIQESQFQLFITNKITFFIWQFLIIKFEIIA